MNLISMNLADDHDEDDDDVNGDDDDEDDDDVNGGDDDDNADADDDLDQCIEANLGV